MQLCWKINCWICIGILTFHLYASGTCNHSSVLINHIFYSLQRWQRHWPSRLVIVRTWKNEHSKMMEERIALSLSELVRFLLDDWSQNFVKSERIQVIQHQQRSPFYTLATHCKKIKLNQKKKCLLPYVLSLSLT